MFDWLLYVLTTSTTNGLETEGKGKENLFYWCLDCRTVVRIERYHKGHPITIVDYDFIKRRNDLRDILTIGDSSQ